MRVRYVFGVRVEVGALSGSAERSESTDTMRGGRHDARSGLLPPDARRDLERRSAERSMLSEAKACRRSASGGWRRSASEAKHGDGGRHDARRRCVKARSRARARPKRKWKVGTGFQRKALLLAASHVFSAKCSGDKREVDGRWRRQGFARQVDPIALSYTKGPPRQTPIWAHTQTKTRPPHQDHTQRDLLSF